MLYKNTHSMVRSPHGDISFLEITTGVLNGDTLEQFLFIIHLDYIFKQQYTTLDSNSHLDFTLIKKKNQ